MTYGTIKVDTVTFTDAGVDKSVTLSGLVQNPTFSGNVTVTGTLSGVTVTGTTANFTSGNFTNISGGTHTITSGVFAAGSAASPSITFTGDLNTGIYSPGADQVAISTGGSGRLFVDASGNVGVGGSAVSGRQLAVQGVKGITSLASTTGTNGTYHFFQNTGGSFYLGLDSSTGSDFGAAYAGAIYHYGAYPIIFGTNGTEKLRITAAGLVGIGTSSPAKKLEVAEGDIQVYNLNAAVNTLSNYGLTFRSINQFGQDRGTIAEIKTYLGGGSDNDFGLQFRTQATTAGGVTTKMTLTPGGSLGIGTSTPNVKTEVSGTEAAVSLRVNSQNAGVSANNYSEVQLADNGALRSYWRNVRDGSGSTQFAYNSSLAFLSDANGTPTERFRCDTSGRLLVGTSSSPASGNGNASYIVVQGFVGTPAGAGFLSLQRGETATNITTDEGIGVLSFNDSNGNAFADITCRADANAGVNDYPGRLVFSTTADGASSPTERLHIKSNTEVQWRNVTELFPFTDNACLLGKTGNRWSAVWAANGTIQTSDKRAKTEISDATLGSNFVKALRPVSYKWIEGGKRHTGEYDADNNCVFEPVPGTRTHWGFIAQEVKEAVDAAGVDFGGWVLTDKDDPNSQQALRYDQFIAPLTKALQEALAKIESLEARLTAAGI